MAAAESRLLPDSNTFDPMRTVVVTLRVELAKRRVDEAIKRLEVAKMIVAEYGQFGRPRDIAEWRSLDSVAGIIRDTLWRVAKERADLRGATFALIDSLRRERVVRIGFLDFLYFSVGVSTTITFGDIVPNHGLTRFLVTAQLLISIVVVGLFLNSLSTPPAKAASAKALRRRRRGPFE